MCKGKGGRVVQDCPHSKANHVSFMIRYMQSLVEWKDALEVTLACVVFPCLEELSLDIVHN